MHKKRIGRLLLFRLTLLGAGVLFLGVLIALSIQKTKPKEVSAVVGSLNITGSATYTTITSTSLNTGPITSGLINGQTISNAANFTGSLTAAGTLTLSNNTISCTGCVDTTDIANGTIGAADIGTDVITAIELAANSVGDSELFNGGTWNITSALGIMGGNVGIGTTGPTGKLHVVSSGAGPFANFDNNNSATYGLIGLYENGVEKAWFGMAGSTQAGLGVNETYAADGISLVSDGTGVMNITNRGTSKTIYLNTGTPNNADFHTFTVKSGNVGIGTTSPGFKLDVNGSTRTLGSDVFAQSDNTNTAYNYAPIQIREAQYGATSGYLPPRLSFHWGGVVASQIGIESGGRIAILNNPGNAYERFVASDITTTQFYNTAGGYNYSNTWMSFNGLYGLYWPNSGHHIYPVDANDFYFRSGTSSNIGLRMANNAGTTYGYFYGDAGGVGILNSTRNWALRMDGANNAFISGGLVVSGASTLSPAGYSPAAGYVCADYSGTLYGYTYCGSSDARLKTNIKDISHQIDVLSSLQKLRGVYFNWDLSNPVNKGKGSKRQVGMIAQDVEKVLPELVSIGSDGYRSLDYAKYTGFLTEVAKAQQAEIVSLKSVMTDFISKFKEGLIETKKLIVDGVDILKRLNELSAKVVDQQKQIDDLKKVVKELKK